MNVASAARLPLRASSIAAERTHVAKTADPIALSERLPGREKGTGHRKPAGLWYQVNGDWQRWCSDEGMGFCDGGFLHRLGLADCNVALVDTAPALDALHHTYARPLDWASDITDIDYWEPDWARVAADFDGLEIAPYLWERRLDLMWYYAWDCASGVIWRPRNAKLTYIGPVVGVKGLEGEPQR